MLLHTERTLQSTWFDFDQTWDVHIWSSFNTNIAHRDHLGYFVLEILVLDEVINRVSTTPFEVKLLGYDESCNSWERRSNFMSTNQLHEYLISAFVTFIHLYYACSNIQEDSKLPHHLQGCWGIFRLKNLIWLVWYEFSLLIHNGNCVLCLLFSILSSALTPAILFHILDTTE